MIPIDAGHDNPNVLDWKYKDLVPKEYGNSTIKSRDELLKKLIAFNQYANHKTRNGCGWY
jgi:hypothetical protein